MFRPVEPPVVVVEDRVLNRLLPEDLFLTLDLVSPTTLPICGDLARSAGRLGVGGGSGGGGAAWMVVACFLGLSCVILL